MLQTRQKVFRIVPKCPKMSQNAHFRRIVVRTDLFIAKWFVNVKTPFEIKRKKWEDKITENSFSSVLFMIVMFVHTWSNLPLGPDVNCSRKHCHSRDLSQRQCQRSSMIFPTDNKTEIRSFSSWVTPQFDEFFDFLRSLLCLLCASISPHCHSTVFISWLWDSMSMCKSWKWNRKRENMSNGIIHAH